MGWKNSRGVNNANQQLSNVYSARGSLDRLGGYLISNGTPNNFIISGGFIPDDRYAPLFDVLGSIVGNMPVIVLHNDDIHIEALVSQAHEMSGTANPLWIINNRNAEFEPFYGMNDMQIINSLRQLAVKLNYSVTPRFERVIRAHLRILNELCIPVSLSGLAYLTQFYDMGEFHENIMALPCGESVSRRIWADLGVDADDGNSQFDLFRAVINNLANESVQAGWNSDNNISEWNCIKAIENNSVMLLSINDMYSTLLLPYLLEELKTNRQQPFFLLIDNVKLSDEQFLEYLRTANTGCFCGIIAENIVELLGGNDEIFYKTAEKMDTFIFFKHSTGKTATTLAEIFGRYDYTKMEISEGTNRGFFKFLPRDRHDDVRYSTENRYRVMPEEIIGLGAQQAIIFDTLTDQIIHYN